MNKNTKIGMVLLLGMAMLILSNCTKNYGYDFENGYTTTDFPDTVDVELDTSLFKIDRSKFLQARIFPGMVDYEEPRLTNHIVDIDLNYVHVPSSDLRISVAPGNWISTGMWAPAGELTVVIVPANVYGLQVQVGAHTDNLAGRDPLQRDPVIYNRKQLFPGVNYVRNLYGGHVYILPPRPLGRVIQIAFTGTVKAPDFFLGQTTDQQWHDMIANTTVPWFELVGRRIVFTLEVAKLRDYPIESPTELMELWDQTIKEAYWDWTGMTEGNPDPKHRAPFNKWRVVHDIQPVVGAQHSGFPVVAMNTNNYFQQAVTVDAVKNSNWGTYHELGHNMQQGSTWSFAGNGEVTCNLFSFKVANLDGRKHSNMLRSWNAARNFLALDSLQKRWTGTTVWVTGTTVSNPTDDAKMTFYTQIFEYYGYEFMTYLYTAARNARFISIDDQSKIDFYYERLSEFTHTDMYRFMREWGLTVSATSRNRISALYPPLNKKLWLYDPYTGEGADTRIEHARNGWVASTNNHQNSYPASNLFDGNNGTFWHECYDNCTVGTVGTNPVIFTVNTGGQVSANGIYVVQRQGNANNHVKQVRMEISNDGNTWNDVGIFPLQQNAFDKQYIEFPAKLSFSQFRISISERAYGNGGTEYNALAELGTWEWEEL